MKAIIISDQNEIIEKLDETLVTSGFDTIIYRWLLKALDNIEEIRPDLVIVSANEYPRHWKTITQFIKSGIGGDKTKVFLLTQTPLDETEKDKAVALGVKGFFNGIDNSSITVLKNLISDNYDVQEKFNGTIESQETDDLFTVSEIIEDSGKAIFDSNTASLIFVNPHSGKMITGSVLSYDAMNKTVEVKPEYFEAVTELKAGDKLETVTFEIDEKAVSYNAEISEVNHSIFIKLGKEI